MLAIGNRRPVASNEKIMKREYQRVFQDKNKLKEMLGLRQKGKSLPWLAKHYSCDHSSIFWQCHKYGVVPGKPVKWTKRRVVKKEDRKPIIYLEKEGINPGKDDYQAYLKAEKKRVKKLSTGNLTCRE